MSKNCFTVWVWVPEFSQSTSPAGRFIEAREKANVRTLAGENAGNIKLIYITDPELNLSY